MNFIKKPITPELISRITCPFCQQPLVLCEARAVCKNSCCLKSYPVVESVPILINEERSIFKINDFLQKKPTFFGKRNPNIINTLLRIIPDNSINYASSENYSVLSSLLYAASPVPKVLIIGGSVIGEGLSELLSDSKIDFIETDVSWSDRIHIICDTHDIPFLNETFDGVIIQAVLEHVVDPIRCVDEIHRVLKKDGLVYSEIPFMQQVHGGRFDFQRYTLLGLRRLFRRFSELKSGLVCGPGMALAWSYLYFLLSFAKNHKIRRILREFAKLTSFFLKYFDYFLIKKEVALDAASGLFFLGKKENSILSDGELIRLYRGGFKS